MTREEMREKVARAISDVRGPLYDGIILDAIKNRFRKMADAAIAIIRGETLEEAAKEVEKWQQVHFDDGGNMHVSNITSTIAAAIRALKEGE